jgi:hypothetical protein
MFYFGYIIYFIVIKYRCCILDIYCIIYSLYCIYYYSSSHSVLSVSFWMVTGSPHVINLFTESHIVNSHGRNYILSRFLSRFIIYNYGSVVAINFVFRYYTNVAAFVLLPIVVIKSSLICYDMSYVMSIYYYEYILCANYTIPICYISFC